MNKPKKLLEVLEVKISGAFQLEVSFNDGSNRQVSLSQLLTTPPPVFEPLKNEEEFKKVSINPAGGIQWDCGADLSADYLKAA